MNFGNRRGQSTAERTRWTRRDFDFAGRGPGLRKYRRKEDVPQFIRQHRQSRSRQGSSATYQDTKRSGRWHRVSLLYSKSCQILAELWKTLVLISGKNVNRFAVPQTEVVQGTQPVGALGQPTAARPGGVVVPARRPTFHRRPANQPTVRIDTCIVGDSSTCDASQHEACATVQGVSACHCKPGYARLTHTLPCKSLSLYRLFTAFFSFSNQKLYK